MPDLPGRSLISAEPVPSEQGGGMLLGCDCGTTTHLIIDWDSSQPVPSQELAWTCDGCASVHWFRIGPPDAGGSDA